VFSATDVAARLAGLPPLKIEAVALYLRLERERPDGTTLVGLQGEIDAAVTELERHAEAVEKLVRLCQQLSPQPGQQIPCGF